ncbi:DUF2147 domain-containing protein [Rhodomicrobium lacus]|uniref:DUF2147 domain-containing protein n=1 Tax=Rhodomicrobium TaxID=1068 RepID=UPI0026E1724A|nr:DUF2147 domain-containing protein [Rhodomicrobium lacus]WKW50032.1 DUF2147 domain-containing protein [Rhodomicrobium lacus]
MKAFHLAAIAGLLIAGPAFAQPKPAAPKPAPAAPAAPAAPSVLGEWLVEDGTAQVRVVSCADGVWGIISWTKGEPGVDSKNPDPAKQTRSVLGMPILLGMKPSADKPGRFDGEVYNAEEGENYISHISLSSPDVLRIEGCVLGGWICGGQDWSRVKTPPQKGALTDQAVCSELPR